MLEKNMLEERGPWQNGVIRSSKSSLETPAVDRGPIYHDITYNTEMANVKYMSFISTHEWHPHANIIECQPRDLIIDRGVLKVHFAKLEQVLTIPELIIAICGCPVMMMIYKIHKI